MLTSWDVRSVRGEGQVSLRRSYEIVVPRTRSNFSGTWLRMPHFYIELPR